MAKLSLGQAAKLSGVSKSTISRALKTGQLSYTARTSAGYEIDPAELFRVFPAKQPETVAVERFGTPEATASNTTVTDAVVEELRRQIEDLRTDRDAWRDQANRLLLTHQPERPRRRGWRRWFGHEE